MAYGSTFHTARKLGAGGRLTGDGAIYEVSDWSPSDGKAYGWAIADAGKGARGEYQKLPDGLRAVEEYDLV